MKIKQTVRTEILSRLTMHDPKTHLAWIKLHFKMLSSMTPYKWDYGEPIKRLYDANNDWQELYQWGSMNFMLHWKRLKKTRAWGWLQTAVPKRWWHLDTHASETIESELTQTNFEELITYVKASSVQFKADVAFIDYWHEEYRKVNSKDSLVTHRMRHWLDDIYWVTVFGDAYVRLFGMEKLLTTPAYKVEKLNDETVFIQLTENLTDSVENFAEFQKIRKAVKDYLDPDAFYQKEKAYEIPSHHDHDFKLVEQGNVFNTPLFDLIPDEYMDRKLKS